MLKEMREKLNNVKEDSLYWERHYAAKGTDAKCLKSEVGRRTIQELTYSCVWSNQKELERRRIIANLYEESLQAVWTTLYIMPKVMREQL